MEFENLKNKLMMEPPSEESLQTVAALAPITAQRKINTHLDEQMPKPYLARALVAAEPGHINGSVNHHSNNMSVLQQHATFFDFNKDGIIYPWDTYKGFRIIGFNIIFAILGALIINGAFSYSTLPGWIPSLLFPIYIANIHKAKHGSDSDAYDTEGRFDPTKFDNIFSKYARKHPDMLSFCEMQAMLKGNRDLNDLFGALAAELEWVFLYILIRNKKGFLEREQVRAMFDGSLFEILQNKNKKS